MSLRHVSPAIIHICSISLQSKVSLRTFTIVEEDFNFSSAGDVAAILGAGGDKSQM